MLDFRVMTFLELCNQKNYTKTAEVLNMTQPAVTQHIQYLEREYGKKLFTHKGKKLSLTEAGKLLQQSARTMAADAESIKRQMQQTEQNHRQWRFGATLTVGEYVLPPALAKYLKKDANVSIFMTVENTVTLLAMLEKGEIDFALLEGYFDKQEYDYMLFMQDDFIGVSAPNFFENTEGLTLEEVVQKPLVVREKGSGTREIFERVLHEHNMSIDHFPLPYQIGNMQAIKYLVQVGCGITFLYRSAVAKELKEGSLVEIPIVDFKLQREYNLVTLKNSLFSEQYKSFAEFLRDLVLESRA